MICLYMNSGVRNNIFQGLIVFCIKCIIIIIIIITIIIIICTHVFLLKSNKDLYILSHLQYDILMRI
jgi:hypothetical protein